MHVITQTEISSSLLLSSTVCFIIFSKHKVWKRGGEREWRCINCIECRYLQHALQATLLLILYWQKKVPFVSANFVGPALEVFD